MNKYIEQYTNRYLEQGVMRKIFDSSQKEKQRYAGILQEEWFFGKDAQSIVKAFKEDPKGTFPTIAKKAGVEYHVAFDWTIPLNIDLNKDGIEQGIKEIRSLWKARELYYKMSLTIPYADDSERLKEIHLEIQQMLKEDSVQTGDITEQVQAYQRETQSVASIEYPFPSLQSWSGGLRNGQVHVIGGESGAGKSLFALAVAVYAVLKGKKVVFFSTEMTQGANLARAILLFQSYCNLETSQEAIDIATVADNFITFDRLLKADEMISELSKHEGIDLVVIDHLQDMDMTDYDSQYEGVSATCTKIKNAALELDVPFLLVSQLNRAKSVGKKGIDQERFLGSGKINQIAHIAMILESKKSDKGEDLPDKILHIVKNRGVAGLKTRTGQVDVKFDPLMRLVEVDKTYDQQQELPSFERESDLSDFI